MEGRPFPPNVQTAENLADRGIIDAVVLPDELPLLVDRALSLLIDPPKPQTRELRTGEVTRKRSAWESIQITRARHRAGVREVLRYGSDATLRLQGTEKGERDSAMIVAMARIDGQPCIVIGQDRTTQSRFKPMGPPRCARPGAGCAWPTSCGCRWCRSSTPRAPSCHPRRSKARSPVRSRDASRGCRRCGCRRCRSSSVRAAAAGPLRCCRQTSSSLPRTRGCRRCRPRARARSCTATSTMPPRWPRRSGSARSTSRERHGAPHRRRARGRHA